MTISFIGSFIIAYSQVFLNPINIEMGIGTILHQHRNGNIPNIRISPNIGINYQNTLHKRWSYEAGIHYINKPFYNMDQSVYFFSIDGQPMEQIIQRIKKVDLHNIAFPLKVGHTFPKIKFQPTIQIGIIPQFSISGEYYSEINLLMNREPVSKKTTKYSIRDKEHIWRNQPIHNTQYFIGIELDLNYQWKISTQYIFNNNIISFMEVPDHQFIDILEGVSYRDNQVRLSIKYNLFQ